MCGAQAPVVVFFFTDRIPMRLGKPDGWRPFLPVVAIRDLFFFHIMGDRFVLSFFLVESSGGGVVKGRVGLFGWSGVAVKNCLIVCVGVICHTSGYVVNVPRPICFVSMVEGKTGRDGI